MIPNAEQIALAEQISQTVQHLLELQFRYNSAAPISKLPPELLSQIFVEHVAQAYEHWKTLPDDIRSQSRSHWFYQFSHVCRRWRNTSLNCEKIWTYIVVDVCSRRSRLGQFSVERLLERSKGPTLAMAIMCGHSGRLNPRIAFASHPPIFFPRFNAVFGASSRGGAYSQLDALVCHPEAP
ncbi:hypothetical protein A0H81_06287 [Grifola frondosa]|uniref:Uncharacterized protein n=1 Tax=Grifola frondosa TaxID=5627 RepID=A0A1C7MAV0_GRIFR|nr:hypothetical protein A0H81_06287 [Grifola frondosa]